VLVEGTRLFDSCEGRTDPISTSVEMECVGDDLVIHSDADVSGRIDPATGNWNAVGQFEPFEGALCFERYVGTWRRLTDGRIRFQGQLTFTCTTPEGSCQVRFNVTITKGAPS
jgi:hypothetical protein